MKKKQRSRALLGVQGQLMLFIGSVTLFTLLLIWVMVTRWLQPQYNATIRGSLTTKAQLLAAMLDDADEPVSARRFGTLYLDEDFWSGLRQAIQGGQLNVDNCCVDISDATCRNVQYYEGLYPCVLHETMGAFGGDLTLTRDTTTAIRLRKALFEQGSIYEIVDTGSTRQMVVGVLTQDGNYGIIVSANLAQITTAAGVLAQILPPIALLLLLFDLLFAVLFSRWYTRPLHLLAEGAREMADGNYDVQVDIDRADEFGLLAE